ncbi:MAG: pyocin activator PrtN family protein [Ottowia sp.]|uniref:pyocin activator PrtN family protein n=1 Tax=Ottowia sp. TaxID=1898956 RepID=UPI003C7361E1
MNTQFLLLAQYNGKTIIPAAAVSKDFFNLTESQFTRKCSAGQIRLPLVRMEGSQKCAKGVHLQDLAEYLDARREAAKKELAQLTGAT